MIREATEQDAEVLAEIYNYYVNNTSITFEERAVSSDDIVERINKSHESGLPWLVALEGQKVIGYAYSVKWSDRAAYRYTAEVSIYLSHRAKARGWGTKLYQALFSNLRNRDLHIAIGGIALPNPASIALHEKFGMKKVAHFKEVGYKFGEWIDVGYWQVQINA